MCDVVELDVPLSENMALAPTALFGPQQASTAQLPVVELPVVQAQRELKFILSVRVKSFIRFRTVPGLVMAVPHVAQSPALTAAALNGLKHEWVPPLKVAAGQIPLSLVRDPATLPVERVSPQTSKLETQLLSTRLRVQEETLKKRPFDPNSLTAEFRELEKKSGAFRPPIDPTLPPQAAPTSRLLMKQRTQELAIATAQRR